ncbi:MAG: short-chain dehydrogenase [Betaproteobacteria bacterium RIFCSPLOWO2_12_FULL_65_14]|nr:MAG: short-chain dehydrogenase [Betaproteobacteria bacterium RIFCSPLOWO2_12_FULL_65_14]
MDLGLKGRSSLITGGSKGIGFSIARFLAAEGCTLHLVARSESDLESAKMKLLNQYGVPVTTHAMDLAERGCAQELAAKYPALDILVNNAGSTPRGTLLEVDEERFRAAFDLKVFGYINLCREFYRQMKARRRGVIINILGNGGEAPDAGYIAGAACNASLMAFTRALGGQSDRDGLRVVGVNPGPVATERLVGLMQTEAKRKFGDESRWQELSKGFPFGRAASVEEIAATVALLASDLSSYTTGTIVTIDGGMVNRGSLI